MSHTEAGLKAGGIWLAAGAIILVLALLFHGAPSPDTAMQMDYIANEPARWAAVHWGAALSLSLFAVAGLIVLTAGSSLTRDWRTISAWAVLVLGAIWTMGTAMGEATVVAGAAAVGNRELFESWWAFGEGQANGFAFLALAVATIAAEEIGSGRHTTPPWAAWVGAIAGIGAFIGWVLGSWLGIAPGSLLWLLSSLVMCLWLAWFGIGLAAGERSVASAGAGKSAAAR